MSNYLLTGLMDITDLIATDFLNIFHLNPAKDS